MKKYTLFLIILPSFLLIFSQEHIRLSSSQAESIFLEHNLHLVAEKMNIDIAEAAILQAKVWNNPELSVSDVSFWSTASQREGEPEIIPPLFGSFGKNTQFSIELSQLIQTAGKRRKLVDKEKVSKEIAAQQFEEILRALKIELRTAIMELNYSQEYLKILNIQHDAVNRLISNYTIQVEKGNISVNELLRLQSVLFEIENETYEIQTEINALQKNMKVLLNIESPVHIEIAGENNITVSPQDLSITALTETALELRPEMKISYLQNQYNQKSLKYEKAQRVPDLTVSVNYDRWGGVWRDFIGVGLSLGIPVFDRNQGNIKAAKISLDQSEYQMQLQQKNISSEVTEAYDNYILSYDFHRKTADNPLFDKLDDMLTVYTKNLINKNISMLEFIDFLDSYKTNKETTLRIRKNVQIQFEELQYAVGTDIK